MKLNCVVVDDSSIQRMIITKLVNNHQSLHLVGDFSNAIEAKSCMSIHSVDLIFLDIEMPIINGFDFLDGLKNKPQIIFITSKADYAVKAFDYDATDYLQKPISVDRFDSAVKRAIDMHKLRNEVSEEEGDYIFIKSNLKKLKVFTSKIKWIEAYGDYVKVVTDEDSNLVLSTMKSFENDLSKDRFLRVHKSFIVNIDKIERFNSKFAEIGVTKIPLSRNKKDDLKKALAIA
ncbi:MAG TPA: LytTR family DNA-binding domain-containing protein [Flavobacterium sp.]|jgi:DNA-binding LytR/AlgR family response regulator|uniref:LytR/AlgR family response regulator transcription factor n=1 Tax=unclassified Flavobacterium TaxID=196869 RepID=UPI000CAF7FBD|nr:MULTISPECIES: LytTR family DNA-binding domain-containing protein [unclassified Flavobacterium]PKP16838.1 MAG: DNA-binding response regulator [Bacteroidetes bacterium HGW-Bacteroidetes-23]HBI02278.1 DNA-binding response regulator [Flavobacterium sp.]HRE78933.1 LytTR family DNA-binding domain-containing protein [Flavobacterium sp.]